MSVNSGRGRVESVRFRANIRFNGVIYREAQIEIDHVNHGLNKRTGQLNKKARSNFTADDVVEFLRTLNNEFVPPSYSDRSASTYVIDIDCPIEGRFHKKKFRAVFKIDSGSAGKFYVVTLIPNWRKR